MTQSNKTRDPPGGDATSRAAAARTGALHEHATLVAALRDPAAYPHPVNAVEVIETHISSVLLAGEYAYKLKKPVDLGFADFSTLARRRECCDAEIRLNGRTAPALYLDVVPVTIAAIDAKPRFGGQGEPVDYAVRMRRFAADARFDQLARAGHLDAGLIDRLAATIAAFHSRCAPVPQHADFGTPETVRGWVRTTTGELSRLIGLRAQMPGEQARIERLVRWTEAEFERHARVFAARRDNGFVRECHGDLHLGNVVLIDGDPVPFDCIEFNPELRYIDVMNDVAFTWMDLLDHDLPRLAARFLNGYLEATGDYEGLLTLRFYAVYRALVRALVAAIRGDQAEDRAEQSRQQQDCARYLMAAEQVTRVTAPLVVLVCGVAASGKTTVAQLLFEQLDAVRVRSDVERKRLAGFEATQRSHAPVGAGLYDTAATRATYEYLARTATTILGAGFPAIVDATFQRRSDRQLFRQLAAREGAMVALVLCEASLPTLRARIQARAARGNDASDATLEVLAHQVEHFEALDPDELTCTDRIDTDTDPATLATRCATLAARLGAGAGSRG
jgi:hypothetical protein